jgi:hypothetical protein
MLTFDVLADIPTDTVTLLGEMLGDAWSYPGLTSLDG